MRKLMFGVVSVISVAAVGGIGGLLAQPASAAQATGTVYVVHGIPATPVDVYVDGARALDDFAPATTAGPLELPAGPHEVSIFAADAADGSGTAVLAGTADVPAGGNVSLVAHLTEAGEPALTPFVNDVTAVDAGKARLVVRHTAAAPAVDVRAGGAVVVPGLTNPNQAALVVPAGTVSADVVLAGTSTVAIGPADLNLAEGTATFVHAIGSAQEQTLALVPLVITGLHSAPSGVPAGTGPTEDNRIWWILTWGGALLVTAAALLRRSQRAAREASAGA